MGGFILRIVFAVLLFILSLSGCRNSSGNSEEFLPIYSTFKNSALYTSPGDFDGDGKMENLFITKPDENYYINILDKDNIVYKKLNYSVDDLKLTIQDINNDTKEDIILNIIQNNCENCYVYTVSGEIITILSPEIIKSKIDMSSIEDYIASECGNFNIPSKDISSPVLKLYYTEMDYKGDEPVFVSEGSIYNKSINTLNIQTTVSINRKGNIIISDVNILPTKRQP